MTKTTTPDTADLLARLRTAIGISHLAMECNADPDDLQDAVDRIEALERALDEIITEATSRNHAIDIARRARHGEGRG